MHNSTQHLHGGLRSFAAAAAIASLAAFGCSTNRTPGDGQPGMTAPATPASTPGTSSGTSNPPMASAANESAATVAVHPRERFLGTINPAGPQPTTTTPQAPTGQFIAPSAYANPQVTVNASISSDPTPVVTGGSATDTAVFLDAVSAGVAGTTAAATVAPTTSATTPNISAASAVTATPTTAAITTTPTMTNTTLTPTTAAIAATPGQFAAGPTMTSVATGASTTILTPTLTSSANPSPTRAANPPLASLRGTPSATSTTSSTPATSSIPTASASTSTTTRTARVVAPVRIVTNANGTVTVTNASTTPPSVIKNQK
jgi:hypothetical protein